MKLKIFSKIKVWFKETFYFTICLYICYNWEGCTWIFNKFIWVELWNYWEREGVGIWHPSPPPKIILLQVDLRIFKGRSWYFLIATHTQSDFWLLNPTKVLCGERGGGWGRVPNTTHPLHFPIISLFYSYKFMKIHVEPSKL